MKKSVFPIGVFALFLCLASGNVMAETPENSSFTDLYKENVDAVQVFSDSVDCDLYVTDDDVYLMSQAVYAESRGEPFDGKVAVASVILNRMKNPKFPHTVKDVITQKSAFSCVKDGKIDAVPDESSYAAVLEALKGNDPTSKAVFFYNPKTATSPWMKNVSKKNVKTIGNHVFFVAG